MIQLTYTNFMEQKDIILKDLKGKAGIYLFTNNLNKKQYIGHSKDLYRRMLEYYSPNNKYKRLKINSIILNAFNKYSNFSFSLKILEIINIINLNNDNIIIRNKLIEREQYFIDLIKPEYNILKIAGRNLGIRLSNQVRLKISQSKKGIVSHRKGEKHTKETKFLIKKNNKMNKQIYLYDINKKFIKQFISIQDAADYTNISRSRISRAC